MYKIFYDNSQFVILVDGTQNTSGMIELDAERNYILTLLPIYDKTLFLPISSTAKIVGGKLICNIPNVKLDINMYYLIPKFAPYIPPSNPQVEMQREFGEHIITIYTDNIPKLLIENSSNFISVPIPEYPEKMQEAVLDSGVLFYILCPHYLCVVFYDYNDYSVLIDKECESYTFDDNGISFKISLADNQGRVYNCHLTFDGKEYTADNEYFDYTNKHHCHEKLIAYDFLQAILAEDYDYCKELLSPTCPQSIDDFMQMFEDLTDIIIPNCPINDNYMFLVFKDNVKKCTYSIKENKLEKVNF